VKDKTPLVIAFEIYQTLSQQVTDFKRSVKRQLTARLTSRPFDQKIALNINLESVVS
tara:strand:- start:962 stop:1132 length:171 start_codon:yes stop_codon:yes gene_type:complete